MASSSYRQGRKRFIAGAVCPGCGAEDKVFVMTEEDGIFRGCNQCDFREKLDDLPDSPDETGRGDGNSGANEPDVQIVKLPS